MNINWEGVKNRAIEKDWRFFWNIASLEKLDTVLPR